MKKIFFLFILTFSILLVACSNSPKPVEEPTLDELKKSGYSEIVNIEVGDNFYKPVDIDVKKDSIVIWKNKGNIAHNMVVYKTEGAGKETFTSPIIGPSSTFNKKFTASSVDTTYYYYCTIHGKVQSGSITVTN